MNVEISDVPFEDKDIVQNLMQLYQYDFTDCGSLLVNDRGAFVYKYLDLYWREKDRIPLLIKAGGKIAGFALLNPISALNQKEIMSFGEFFILRYLRNRSIGKTVAIQIINRFPGKWEISQTFENVVAQKFWLKVAKEVVGEDFQFIKLEEERKYIITFANLDVNRF
ncbi:MAG: GNAT family N-acetyltransferase [Spirochaetota bacterium]